MAKLRACTKCWSVAYCCRECQVSDWADHKTWCTPRPKPKPAPKPQGASKAEAVPEPLVEPE